MVDVAQLVRAADCGSVGRGFEPHLPPLKDSQKRILFVFIPPDLQLRTFLVSIMGQVSESVHPLFISFYCHSVFYGFGTYIVILILKKIKMKFLLQGKPKWTEN